MRRLARMLLLLAFTLPIAGCRSPGAVERKETGPGPNRIVNLYDAFGGAVAGTILDFGFSCLIVHEGKVILFDSGSDADILEANAEALGIDLRQVDFAVGSHAHGDHLDGFDYLLRIHPAVKIYLPDDFRCGAPVLLPISGPSPGVAAELSPHECYFGGGKETALIRTSGPYRGAEIEYVKESGEIAPGVTLIVTRSPNIGYFTRYPPHEEEPKLIGLPELSLSIRTKAGEVLVVGCSHSDVGRIVEAAREETGREIDLVAGGYHMLPYDEETVTKVAMRMRDDLGVRRAAPGHCTGHIGFKVFRKVFGENYHFAGLGAEIPISE